MPTHFFNCVDMIVHSSLPTIDHVVHIVLAEHHGRARAQVHGRRGVVRGRRGLEVAPVWEHQGAAGAEASAARV